jgi:hypothetical protein
MPLRWNLIDSESFRELIARRLPGLILPRNRAHARTRRLSIKMFDHEHDYRGARNRVTRVTLKQ